MNQKKLNQWRESYLRRLNLSGLTNQEMQEIRNIIWEIDDPFFVESINLMPPFALTTSEAKSESSRLWLLSRQNWMIIEQLSRLNQTMEKLLELEMSYADK